MRKINKLLIIFTIILSIVSNSCYAIDDDYNTLLEDTDYDYDYYEEESYDYEYEKNYENLSAVISYNTGSDYMIDSYDIDMIVNENNTFDITETITVYFNTQKHGIIRKIPLKNTITRLDKTTSKNRALIKNIRVNEHFTLLNENGYKLIKIGNQDSTITGTHTYTIKYNYNIGKDPLKDADELYFNLIGNEWDTSIDNVSFKIHMPKEFDETLLGFSSGIKGSVENSNIEYSVDGNTISGTVNNTLYEGEGLTIRLTLPEGYFVDAGFKVDLFSVLVIILSIAFLVIAYLLWAKFGKDEQVIQTVEFYPPEGLNSAELGFLYNGSTNNESVLSLLIYLANKGYLKIEEIGSKELFKITKLKEYDGNNELEKMFFEGLFKERTTVTKSDLYDKFYTTINKIKLKLNSKENKEKFFEKSANKKIKWLIFMAIAIFILSTIQPLINYYDGELFKIPLILTLIVSVFVFAVSKFLTKRSLAVRISEFIVIGGVFGVIPWYMMILPSLLINNVYLTTHIIGIICIIGIIIFIRFMPKRTAYGNEIIGKLEGFRKFLVTAEKNQLESLVMENPEYFYNILPFTYSLGISDLWISQFESIALVKPSWYESDNDISNFDASNFGVFISSTMSVASLTSSSSSSGGSSSGGGSSGGGSGGGGGSSW